MTPLLKARLPGLTPGPSRSAHRPGNHTRIAGAARLTGRLSAVPHAVPGLVGAEHRHLRQDEQTGEPKRHRPGHGAVPCEM